MKQQPGLIGFGAFGQFIAPYLTPRKAAYQSLLDIKENLGGDSRDLSPLHGKTLTPPKCAGNSWRN